MAEEYKDITWVNHDGTRPKTWFRIGIKDIPEWVNRAKADNAKHVFTTIQTWFNSAVTENEEADMPFYMDFDGETIKSPDNIITYDIKTPLEDMRKVVTFFQSAGLDSDHISCWFSGKKGFHLTVPRRCFGGKPSPSLYKIWRNVALGIARDSGVTKFDDTVYSRRRMWRVENTINGGSAPNKGDPLLYKIPVDTNDILLLTADYIRSLAVDEQVSHVKQYVGRPIERLKQLFDFAEKNHTINIEPSKRKSLDITFDNPPPCIKAILEKGLLTLGSTNMTMFRLAAYFKWQDVPMARTITMLNAWAENITPQLSHDLTPTGEVDYKKIRREIHSVCRSVYSGQQYGFSCNGILQIPGLDKYCTTECKESLEEQVSTSLFESLQASHLGKRLYIEAEAIGRKDVAYMIPDTIKVWCETTSYSKCASCPLYDCPDGLTINVNAKNPGILLFLMPSNQNLTARVGQISGLPPKKECPKWHYKITYRNMEVIFAAPQITNQFTKEDTYTRQNLFYLGHGLRLNQSYRFSGYVHIHDKTNIAQLVIDKAEPLAGALSEFSFTKGMKKSSMIFQPDENESYEHKHKHIANMLNDHVCYVWGRELLIRAIDLAYHSVNKVKFQREIINARADVLVLGDTGQGKSKIIESLMQYYNLGVKVSGESAKRTGLLFAIPVKESEAAYIAWGILPRHTRRLVFLDEANKLIEEGGFAELTEVRSAGYIDVAQVVRGRAAAETRLVTLTNAVGKKTMGTYFYPVLATLDLFPDRADIRRFTYVVGVASAQVEDELINQNIEDIKTENNPYVDTICHNHILWAWTLEPGQIIIDADVQKLILKLANYMCRQYIATIPLVEPGDFRHKLVRVATAAAARMYSVDEHNMLVVTPQAVKYAFDFLNELYSEDSLRYLSYSASYSTFSLQEADKTRLAADLEQRWPAEHLVIVKWLMVNEYSNYKEIAVATQFSEADVKECLGWLAANKLLDTTSRGHYTKTEIGVLFIEHLLPDEFTGTYKTADEVISEVADDEY